MNSTSMYAFRKKKSVAISEYHSGILNDIFLPAYKLHRLKSRQIGFNHFKYSKIYQFNMQKQKKMSTHYTVFLLTGYKVY